MGGVYSYMYSVNRKYGWKRDRYDNRDHVHNFVSCNQETVDLSLEGPQEIYDQGALGSCTANAIAFAFEFDEYKKNATNKFTPSRLFIYYNEREMEGNVSTDSGAEIRDGIKSINTIGVCPETVWPYDISKFTQKPKQVCYNIARNHKTLQYKRILPKLEQIKSGLANGYPIVFGFTVYESFESQKTADTGIVKMPKKTEKILGGHAVTLVGYDDTKKMFKVRNSWSKKWGDNGYCYFPYDYINNSNLCSDFWTVERIM
jgi:C1A family cysteine protease